jgi:carboxymethylenebutenolidase
MEIHAEELTVRCTDGVEMPAFLARPSDAAPHPAILVIHEAWGLNDQIRGVARRYAAEGFVALAPHLFARNGDLMSEANIESVMRMLWSVPPEKRNDPATLGPIMEKATEQQRKVFQFFFLGREGMEGAMVEDLVAGARFLQGLPFVQSANLGVTGFCMGGGLSYQMATVFPLKAAVPFYGANPKPIDSVAGITGAVFGMYAGNDERINAGVPALVEAMVRHRKEFAVRLYKGTNHAFFNEQRPSYDAEAAADAWGLALAFFRKYLR